MSTPFVFAFPLVALFVMLNALSVSAFKGWAYLGADVISRAWDRRSALVWFCSLGAQVQDTQTVWFLENSYLVTSN